MRTRFTIAWYLVLIVTLVTATGTAQTKAANDEETIRALDEAWDKAAQDKDLDKVVSYYADDASMFPYNAPIATGKDQIRHVWSKLLATPGYGASFAPSKIHVAQSGDMAYETSTFAFQSTGPGGSIVSTPGKFVVVWRKQSSGDWKVVADIFNTDK